MKSLKDLSTSDRMEGPSTINLALLDPPRWGWCALGGVIDLSTPQEVRSLFSKTDEACLGERMIHVIPFSFYTNDMHT